MRNKDKQIKVVIPGGTWTGTANEVMEIYYKVGQLKGMAFHIDEPRLDKVIDELEVLTDKLIPL